MIPLDGNNSAVVGGENPLATLAYTDMGFANCFNTASLGASSLSYFLFCSITGEADKRVIVRFWELTLSPAVINQLLGSSRVACAKARNTRLFISSSDCKVSGLPFLFE